MNPQSSYYAVSGPGLSHCVALAQRWDNDEGYDSNVGEFWLVSVEETGPGQYLGKLHYHYEALVPGLWLSERGGCFLAGPFGSVHVNPDLWALDAHTRWTDHQVMVGAPGGIWGLREDCVYCWGSTRDAERVFHFDGKTWRELPSPGFRVHAMHGLSPDFLYAVGQWGSIARWDGHHWIPSTGPTEETLTSVFVAAPEEIYAVGFEGTILEGSVHGWGKIGEGPRMPVGGGVPLLAVAKWKDEVWVGAGYQGLFRRVGNTNVFECLKPKVHAVCFDARGTLLMAAISHLIETADAQRFVGTGENVIEDGRKGRPLYEY